ncbi:MAG: hypothetical protein DDT32_01948 [Syntrophomonadaceae bacterium]|nr:hypothetical protein [Bacillota bacterium]
MRKKLMGVMVVAVLLTAGVAVPQVMAYPHTGDTGVTSPLYQVRVDQAKQVFAETPNVLTETGRGENDGDTVSPQIFWSGHVSGCIGSACLLSGCLGSACKWSGCLFSACLGSGCFGSGCTTSGCLGSACKASGCVGSACIVSGCVFSACLNCP